MSHLSKGWSICQKVGPFVKRLVHLSKGWSICQKVRSICQRWPRTLNSYTTVVTLYVVVRSWVDVIDKQAKKMQPVQVVVGEVSPGLGLVVVFALSLMSTSLQRNASCSSSASRAYASFPTTRTETQRAGVVLRLKEQQSNLFPRRDPRKSQNSFDQS